MSTPSLSTTRDVPKSRRPRRAAGRENFIPLRKADLRRIVLGDPTLSPLQREQLTQLCQLLEATIHHDYHERLERLKDRYAPFDPDADTKQLDAESTGEAPATATDADVDAFFEPLMDLLDRANYQHLHHEHLNEAIGQASAFGLHLDVDLTVFRRLEIFARGSRVVRRKLPGLLNRWKRRTIDIPVYQRLVLVFRLRKHPRLAADADTHTIHVKIFKDIPKPDLDMLLPGTRVKFSWVDRGKIVLPTLSGIALSITKILKVTAILAVAGVYGMLGLLGLVGGTIGYGLRSFFTYASTKDRYHLSLTRSLYFQNLDNNAGVLFRLLDEAEEQDFREAMLGWFLLWKHGGSGGWSVEQLDLAAEQFILEHTGVHVDFDIGDAIDKLVLMKLVVPASGGKWRALEIDEAAAVLDATWDALYHAEHSRRTRQMPHFHRSPSIQSPLDSNDWGPVL